jgi:hypothetical protein
MNAYTCIVVDLDAEMLHVSHSQDRLKQRAMFGKSIRIFLIRLLPQLDSVLSSTRITSNHCLVRHWGLSPYLHEYASTAESNESPADCEASGADDIKFGQPSSDKRNGKLESQLVREIADGSVKMA